METPVNPRAEPRGRRSGLELLSAAQRPHEPGLGRRGHHSGVARGPEEGGAFPRMSSGDVCGKPLADRAVKGGVSPKEIVIPNND